MKGTPYAVPRHSKNGSGLDPSAGEPTETSPTFSLSELKAVVSTLTFGRCAGADGIEAEMFDYTGEDLLQCLMDIFNRMIAWYRTVSRCYMMLPKTGGSSKPSSWRPIPVLKISYIMLHFLLGCC